MDIIKYFFVGGTAALSDLIIFYLFADMLGYNYLVITILGFIIATLINYFLSITFVFKSGVRFNWQYEILLVYLVSIVGLLVHVSVLSISIESLSLDLMTSKIIAIGSAFIFNYMLRKYVVFKQ